MTTTESRLNNVPSPHQGTEHVRTVRPSSVILVTNSSGMTWLYTPRLMDGPASPGTFCELYEIVVGLALTDRANFPVHTETTTARDSAASTARARSHVPFGYPPRGGGLREQVQRSRCGAGLRSRWVVETTPRPHQGDDLGVDKRQKPLGRDLVRRHDMAVHVEAHGRPRVSCPLCELACGNTRLVPDRDPAMTKVMRVVGEPSRSCTPSTSPDTRMPR